MNVPQIVRHPFKKEPKKDPNLENSRFAMVMGLKDFALRILEWSAAVHCKAQDPDCAASRGHVLILIEISSST